MQQEEKRTSPYRNIIRGTALFGGVQIFNVLINVIRGKLIAMILGPEGMGISSLLVSSTTMLQQFSSLGLNFSAVKDLSFAKEQNDFQHLSLVIVVLRRLLHFTALIGGLASILFARQLSLFAFGNTDYKWHFIFLSVMVYFTTLTNGELAIMQGSRMLRQLAYSSVIGSSLGLLIGIPLYYCYGYAGIVPAMIILSLTTYSLNRFFANKLKCQYLKVTWHQTRMLGKVMAILGVVMMISTLLGNLCSYSLNAVISHWGSLNDVGLYQAANSITNQYVGVVFAAMGADFFPRLAGVANDNVKIRSMVNQQSEIVMLIVAPLAILLIVTAPLLIRLLLSEEFLSIIPVVRWMGLGIFFKALIFPMGYIAFSKGDKKFFLWFEGVYGNTLIFVLNVIFYCKLGISGIGISFVVSFILLMITYIVLTKKRYEFYYSQSFLRTFIPLFIVLCVAFMTSFISNVQISYSCMIISLILCLVLSFYGLNTRLNFIKLKLW